MNWDRIWDTLLSSGYGTYILFVLPALLLSLWAQFKVKSTFHRYSNVQVQSGLTGEQASLLIQRANGLSVPVTPTAGELTDYYDPSSNAVFLSEPVYARSTVAAVGVAAHETGHALQHAQAYTPIRVRTAMVKPTQFAATITPVLLLLGIFLSLPGLIWLGVALFSVSTLFQIVTLPVEFNASARAVRALQASRMLTDEEIRGVKKVLTAAALTYVGALAVSLAQLLRLLLLVSGRGRRR